MNKSNDSTKELRSTIKNFKNVIVFFSVEWCGESKMLENVFPIFMKTEEFKAVKFIRINIDDAKVWKGEENSKGFNILTTPTIIFFKSGEESFRKIGFTSREEFNKDIKKLIGTI